MSAVQIPSAAASQVSEMSAVYTVAISTMAPRSSMMANATMNNLSATGTRAPSNAMTASANAISVAMGMPKPDSVAVPLFSVKWISAGAAMPPTAANAGPSASRTFDSAPV